MRTAVRLTWRTVADCGPVRQLHEVSHVVRGPHHHHGPMFVARLLCSDQACAEPFEARARTLAELATLACDCGCGLEVLGISLGPEEPPDPDRGPDPGGASVVLLAA